MQEKASKPERRSLVHALVFFIVLYVLLPAVVLLVVFFSWNLKSQRSALLADADVYFSGVSSVCDRHIGDLSNLMTVLQDSSAIREELNRLNLSPGGEAVQSAPIADVISAPLTYQTRVSNFSINAVGVYFRDDLVFYTIPQSGIDLALDRTKAVYESLRDVACPAGRFVSGAAQQSAYAYYVQDYMNIYNGRYYGKVIVEVAPIPSNLPQSGSSYLPASVYSLDLQSHPSMQYYLYGPDQTVVFSNDSAGIGQGLSALVPGAAESAQAEGSRLEGGTVVFHQALPSGGLSLYAAAGRREFAAPGVAASVPIVLVIFLLYLAVLMLGLRNLYTPLKQVSAYCRAAAQYDRPLAPSFESRYQELGEVAAILTRDAEQIEALQKKCRQAESERQENQLRLLQTQMNPHFLFNMLDIISWKAEQTSSKDISSMIDYLGEILRYEIKQDQAKIPLRQEVSYIYQYLGLQQLGNSHEFTYTIKADNETLDEYCIPKLVLQPLVENAIVHGILPSDRAGDIQIDIWEDMDGIMCRVKDNGVGFDSEAVLGAQQAPDGKHNRIALSNIRKRLHMLYGEPYGLTICSTPGAGTVATIYIPFDPVAPKGGSDVV